MQALLDAIASAGRPGQDNTTVLVYRVGDGADSLHGALAGANDAGAGAATVQEKPSAGNREAQADETAEPQGISRGYWVCYRGAAGRNGP